MAVLRCFVTLPSNPEKGGSLRLGLDDKLGLMALPSSFNGNVDVSLNMNDVYNEIIHRAVQDASEQLEDAEIKCLRGEDIGKSGDIVIQLLKEICESDMTIIDATAANPNVLWEYGIRQVVQGQHNLLIRHAKSKLPFNITQHRAIAYDTTLTTSKEARNAIALAVLAHARNILGGHSDFAHSADAETFVQSRVKVFSGVEVQEELANTYDSEKTQVPGQQLVTGLAGWFYSEGNRGDSTAIAKDLRKFLLGLGEILKTDIHRAVQYYERIEQIPDLPMTIRSSVYNELAGLYDSLGDQKKTDHYIEVSDLLDSLS